MIENSNISKKICELDFKAWPLLEAKKIVAQTKDNDVIVLQTGYGPSNTAHIGTITEVVRTAMVAKALRLMQDKPIIILSIVDDLDGMRKIPPSIPSDYVKFLGYPLCNLPDPNGQFDSFATSNISKFKQLLKLLDFKYFEYIPSEFGEYNHNTLKEIHLNYPDSMIIVRSSSMYKSGAYNSILKEILNKHKEVLNIMLPSLGEERRKTYSPFMPISPFTNKVLENEVIDYLIEEDALLVEENGHQYKISIFNGNCKLQWKVDFGMRWAFYSVDYEMVGKDIAEGTVPLSKPISILLTQKAPITTTYEMYLDPNGTKISKTKGNGIELFDFIKYITPSATKYFMYLSPMVAKKIDLQKLPAYFDDYIKQYANYKKDQHDMNNPLFYTNIIPDLDIPNISAHTALNLIDNLHTNDFDTLSEFIKSRLQLNKFDEIILKCMFDFYYDKYIQPERKYFPQYIVSYIYELISKFDEISAEEISAEEIQAILYSLGNLALKEPTVPIFSLKEWFLIFYQCLFGADKGPRLGSFFALCGNKNSKELLLSRIQETDRIE